QRFAVERISRHIREQRFVHKVGKRGWPALVLEPIALDCQRSAGAIQLRAVLFGIEKAQQKTEIARRRRIGRCSAGFVLEFTQRCAGVVAPLLYDFDGPIEEAEQPSVRRPNLRAVKKIAQIIAMARRAVSSRLPQAPLPRETEFTGL